MIIEQSLEYLVLKEELDDEFIEMTEYSVSLYYDGIIINDNGEIKVTDKSKVDMVKLDLDAVRWWLGFITLDEYVESINTYYKRS